MSDDQYLADAILAMAKLSPGERATVISVVDRMRFTVAEATVKPIAEPNQKRPPRERYTIYQKAKFRSLANQWEPMTDQQRQDAIDSLAGQYHRTPSQIDRQIYYYRTGK